MSDAELAVLAKRARDGDRGAFEGMVRRTGRMVYAQIVAAVRDRQRAEDLTQETFIAAWKALPTLREVDGVKAWLLTLARNKVLDAIRFEGRRKRKAEGTATAGGVAGDVADDGATPAEEMACREECARAVRLLEELPEQYRRVLMLRYLGGADYETMRKQLGLSDAALRGLMHRGMAMLRERMTTPPRRREDPRRKTGPEDDDAMNTKDEGREGPRRK